MELKTIVGSNLDETGLRNLVNQYCYGRYCEDPSLPISSSRKLLLDLIRQFVSHGEGIHLEAVSSSSQVGGSLFFKYSKWDTEHFGYPVATVEFVLVGGKDYKEHSLVMDALLSSFQSWLEENKIRFVSVLVPSMNLAALHGFERWGFRFIENNIFNKYDLRSVGPEPKPLFSLRQARPDDQPAMARFSKGAFSPQRFYADPYIDLYKADSLYEKWITTVFSGPLQNILVLDVDAKAAAFMVYEKKDFRQYFGLQFAIWKMAIINPQLRGRGLGTKFFNSLKAHHREEGMDVVDSCFTMRNLTSFNLHNRCDFKIVSSSVTFHKWLAPLLR